MQDGFRKFTCPNTRKGEFTHTLLSGGLFLVPPADTDEFFELYESCFRAETPLHIAERPLKSTSLFKTDLDFKFEDERVLKKDEIVKIVDLYLDVFKEIFTDLDQTRIYVMEKNERVPAQKKGLHIISPDIVLSHALEHVIRQSFINKARDFFRNELKPSNRVEDVVDKCVIDKNCWLLYGSKKPKDPEPYHVTHAWKIQGGQRKTIPLEKNPAKYIKMFSLRRNNDKAFTQVQDHVISYIEQREQEYREELARNEERKIMKEVDADTPERKTDEVYYKLARDLVDCLSTDRVNNYSDWIDLGFCLHSIDGRLLQKWDQFSSKVPDKYDSDACSMKWKTMHYMAFQLNKLKKWAETDNPDKYHEVMMSSLENQIMLCVDSTKKTPSFLHHKVAELFKLILRNTTVFICGQSFRQWMHFQDHRWRKDPGTHKFTQIIRYTVVEEIKKLRLKKRREEKENLDNGLLQKNLKDFDYALECLISKIYDTPFLGNVIKASESVFEDSEFVNLLDSKQHLLCFKNGVYDLEADSFRAGEPDDYCHMCTNIDYVEYNPSHPIYKDMNQYLDTVFVNEELRYYILKLLASFLNGNVIDQKFYFWLGGGSNSKSKFVELYQKCLGDYTGTLPTTLLTSPSNKANEANPALASIKGKRFMPMSESQDGPRSKLQVGMMKMLTGGDRIPCRGLYQDHQEITPHVRLVYISNHLPILTENDHGTLRRLVVIKFSSTFVDPEDYKGDAGTFVKDPTLEHQKLPKWPPYFMSLLLYYYKIFKYEGLKEPLVVKEKSEEYKLKADVLTVFAKCKMQLTQDPEDKIHYTELYQEYVAFLDYGNVSHLKISKDLFCKSLTDKKFKSEGPPTNLTFTHLILKDKEE